MSPPVQPRAKVLHLHAPSLLARLRAREPEAAGELFDLHAATVERAIAGVIGPDAELEDLVQDVFLAGFRGIDAFRGDDATLGAWLRGIGVRMALKKLRWRRRRRWLSWSGTDTLPALRAPTDTRTQAALGRAYGLLDRLPDLHRAAFGLRFIEGMQLDEVAQSLGVSLATTKRYLRAARERFATLAAADPLLADWLDDRGAP